MPRLLSSHTWMIYYYIFIGNIITHRSTILFLGLFLFYLCLTKLAATATPATLFCAFFLA